MDYVIISEPFGKSPETSEIAEIAEPVGIDLVLTDGGVEEGEDRFVALPGVSAAVIEINLAMSAQSIGKTNGVFDGPRDECNLHKSSIRYLIWLRGCSTHSLRRIL